jgi:SAM-dependent methyltransferase
VALRGIVDRVLQHPAVYAAWQAPFAAQKFRPAQRELSRRTVRRVLDVGCGPGTNAARFPRSDYVGLDINPSYLAMARAKYAGVFVEADMTSADLSTLGTFDTILVNSFLHHVPDQAVERILRQLERRLTPDGRAHVLELVLPERTSLARAMARLDRGRYARSVQEWCGLLGAHLEPVVIEPYTYAGGLWSMIYFQGKTR